MALLVILTLVLSFGACIVLVFYGVRGAARAIAERQYNARQPIVSTAARVVGKRTTAIWGGVEIPASTFCFVTFELPEGDRRELPVPSQDYALLAEGDVGTLRSQGTAFKSFERQRTAVSAPR